MIPTLLALGFVAGLFGRRGWWFVLVAVVGWPVLLWVTGVDDFELVSAFAFAWVNTALGVLVGNAVRWGVDAVGAGTSAKA